MADKAIIKLFDEKQVRIVWDEQVNCLQIVSN